MNRMSLQEALLKHFEEDAKNFKKITDTLCAMDKKLEPISATYLTVGTLGRWLMPLLVCISLVIGSIWGILQIIGFYHPKI